jgi:hypothetical protein
VAPVIAGRRRTLGYRLNQHALEGAIAETGFVYYLLCCAIEIGHSFKTGGKLTNACEGNDPQ